MQKEILKAISIFILILLFIPFYESKRVIIWETQTKAQKENFFRPLLLNYSLFSESLKEKFGLENFFEKEHFFWLRLKKSPIIFQETKIQQEKVEEKEIEKVEKEEEKEKSLLIESPYRILIIGDSFIAVYGGVGDPLERELLKFKDVKVYRLGRVASGLSRPDYFNWELTAKELIDQQNPNIAIVMLGLNDAQALTTPEGKVVVNYVKFGKEEWKKEYGKRVENLLNIFKENKILVFWIGLPIMKNKSFSDKIEILNSIYEEVTKNYENAYFIPTQNLLADENGNYTAYLKEKDGKNRLVRSGDGIHLTYFGGEIVVQEIIEEMQKVIKLELIPKKK